ncbi:NADH-quinone oxidoreductase subunit NuoN [Leeia aquatica]|uniref:NADH-quinone oxidoreductase subunit N n=1 Tax=Leeia aquatica TaxID=2725557 RepID=A0A847S5I6_9NEIS|nr:NADH-quinone oxidoreductase subunit NuoN [Leeia aquatica]NLR74055.1 NADH-quinone oxidoreductase subunit NuoN [Leeia aquatica]
MMLAGINLTPALPELFLLCAASLLLIVDLLLGDERQNLSYALSLLALLGTGWLVWHNQPGDVAQYTFNRMFVLDGMAWVTKLAAVMTVALVMVFGRVYAEDRGFFKSEYRILMLFALFGLFVLISANNLLAMYVGLEVMSLATYALVALERDSVRSTEAAMKYFVLGALASGMLLYGMSMVYGGTRTLFVEDIAAMLSSGAANAILVKIGLVFMVAGLAFKLGAVPFHMWVPDVYHGSPTAVTLFVSSAPKLAAFVFLTRTLVIALPALHVDWQMMLTVLAVASIAIGNLTAIAQTNLKRMLAYSAISHMGFVILGVMTNTQDGVAASMFYVVTYMLMTLGGFGLILLLARSGFEAENLSDLKGLAKRSPLFGGVLLLVMFSMAGIPSTVGFISKFSVLSAVLASGQTWLTVTVVLLSVIGAFYYLRIVKLAYFDAPESSEGFTRCPSQRVLLVLTALAILALGVMPQWLLDLCSRNIHLG